jgi:hypothetical protein
MSLAGAFFCLKVGYMQSAIQQTPRARTKRSASVIAAQRQSARTSRELRDTPSRFVVIRRQVAAQSCGADLVFDRNSRGHFGDNSGHCIDLRPTMDLNPQKFRPTRGEVKAQEQDYTTNARLYRGALAYEWEDAPDPVEAERN